MAILTFAVEGFLFSQIPSPSLFSFISTHCAVRMQYSYLEQKRATLHLRMNKCHKNRAILLLSKSLHLINKFFVHNFSVCLNRHTAAVVVVEIVFAASSLVHKVTEASDENCFVFIHSALHAHTH